ncbi:MAG: hypothetical protein AAFR53_02410, partial [Pseudomonadota bacterium]
MSAYILRRLLLVIPTLFGVMLINFALVQFVPGGPVEQVLAQLEGEGILMTVLAPNGNPPDGQARRVLGWTGELEFTGEYTLQLSPA